MRDEDQLIYFTDSPIVNGLTVEELYSTVHVLVKELIACSLTCSLGWNRME